jgi:hypothetical protein
LTTNGRMLVSMEISCVWPSETVMTIPALILSPALTELTVDWEEGFPDLLGHQTIKRLYLLHTAPTPLFNMINGTPVWPLEPLIRSFFNPICWPRLSAVWDCSLGRGVDGENEVRARWANILADRRWPANVIVYDGYGTPLQ